MYEKKKNFFFKKLNMKKKKKTIKKIKDKLFKLFFLINLFI